MDTVSFATDLIAYAFFWSFPFSRNSQDLWEESIYMNHARWFSKACTPPLFTAPKNDVLNNMSICAALGRLLFFFFFLLSCCNLPCLINLAHSVVGLFEIMLLSVLGSWWFMVEVCVCVFAEDVCWDGPSPKSCKNRRLWSLTVCYITFLKGTMHSNS